MLWLYRLVQGFLSVEFSGEVSESILNICAKNGIAIWNIKRKNNKISAFITVNDFKYLPYVCRKKGIRVHILKRYGLPFTLNRYKKRWGIPVGALVFFAILYSMSQFIWIIDVEGNKVTDKNDILSACYTIGINEGIYKNNLNVKTLSQELLLRVDTVSWASLNIEGCKLTVNVAEAPPKKDDNKNAANLISVTEGEIVKIDITAGNPVVKVGDIVAKGDLLVSGIIENPNTVSFVNSKGSIIAKTEKHFTLDGYFKRKVSVPTGKVNIKTAVSFFNIDLPLYLGNEIGTFNAKYKTKQIKLLGEKIPLSFYTGYFEKTNEKEIKISQKDLEKELTNKLDKKLKDLKLVKYEIKKTEFENIDGGIRVMAEITAFEEISKQEILLFNIEN